MVLSILYCQFYIVNAIFSTSIIYKLVDENFHSKDQLLITIIRAQKVGGVW